MGGRIRKGQDELPTGEPGAFGTGYLKGENSKYPHRPVLLDETLHSLLTNPEGIYVDGTVGSGGHSEGIAANLGPRGRLICLDRDSAAVDLSRERLSVFGERVSVRKGNFAGLDLILETLGLTEVDGILLDLGISTVQLERSGRGFSFRRDEPLDMRMDHEDSMTAQDLINNLSSQKLETILRQYGEERKAKRIVRALGEGRRSGRIQSSLRLAELIESAVPRSSRPGSKHPATRSFQALRIAVNRELENLDRFLEWVPTKVKKGGRLVVLTYHSLEDRMVKQAMLNWEKGCICPRDFPRCVCGRSPLFRRLRKKGVKPSPREIGDNPRARSATLRAAERI
ncbi:MAG: 16S rRNA (cytosine(1402)-N(4))-methyltransferase RsmH [Deltaproteobacteria bacterium]|nr:16S rRNA (cytosine(1402)-N(4))-methyltransferase RsmH [Deltaproteobacteria bacterium]